MWYSYLTGIIAGALGLGGGLVLNPVMIRLGFKPVYASAMSSMVVLFSSLASMAQFLIVGAFDVENTIIVIIVSGLGAFVGCWLTQRMVQRNNA